LNEFDSKLSGNVDWRQKLEAQTGAVLATEMKNNANKLSRWVAEAVLSGAHELRLGFVTRTVASDPNKHSVLMVKSYTPLGFAKLLDIKVRAQWGSLKYILESLQKLDDGKYVLMKDPNKASLRVYQVPSSFVDETPVAAPAR
jgi:translation initiation factor 3 subunit D